MLECQICHMGYNHLGSHIAHGHKIKAKEYKKMFGLDYSTALISPEIKLKKQIAFEKDREKYLSNFKDGEKYQFTKGSINRFYFSKESQERANNNLDLINSQLVKLICPFCDIKYLNLNTHLMNTHKIKIMRLD